MNINQMRYFVSLVEHNNFTKAARECVVTQPALSQQVKQLEQELKVPLLIRNGRSFEVTPAGKLLYQRLIHVLQEISDISSQVTHVGENFGSTLRLGLPSYMDHHQLTAELTEQVLNHTGLELSLVYGSHGELFDKFGDGSIHAFVSDEMRLTRRDSYRKISLCSNKMCVEYPHDAKVNYRGITKFKLETTELKHQTIAYVCEPEHLAEEKLFLEDMLNTKLNLVAVESISAGRKAILASEPKAQALLFMRSLLKGDYQFDPNLTRYELIYKGDNIKRDLSCYAKPHLNAADLKELCKILCKMGSKQRKLRSGDGHPDGVKPLHEVREQSSNFSIKNLAL